MMRFRPTTALQVWNRTRQWGYDSMRLGQVLWSSLLHPQKYHNDRRELLLQLATEESNVAARKWLHLEREWHLLQYYGISEYWAQHGWRWNNMSFGSSSSPRLQLWFSSSSDASSSTSQQLPQDSQGTDSTTTTGSNHSSSNSTLDSKVNDNNNNNNRKKAQIAFMITSSMRQELLGESYRYDAEQIKHMTPIDASLILQHGITSKDYEERLPIVKQEYYRMIQEEQQKAKEEALAVEEAQQQRRQQQQEEERLLASSQSHASEPSLLVQEAPPSSPFQTSADDNHETTTPREGYHKWYQIVEYPHKDEDDSEPRVVAMYKDWKEAQFGMEVHQDLANRRRHRHTSKPITKTNEKSNDNQDENDDVNQNNDPAIPVSRFEIQTVYKK
jgi:hypothetical protein